MKLFNLAMILPICFLLVSCGESGPYDYSVGVFNNTGHEPVKIKIQYPSPDGMKRIRFSMIGVGEWKANLFDTKNNPVPAEAKISWENGSGQVKSAVLDLSGIQFEQNDGAIIFDIDEQDATVNYLDTEQFAGQWESRLVRKGYK